MSLRAARQIVRIDFVGHGLETEELRARCRRIEDVRRHRGLGGDFKRERAIGPTDMGASIPIKKGVVDPTARQRFLGRKIPLGARGDAALATEVDAALAVTWFALISPEAFAPLDAFSAGLGVGAG